MMFQHLKLYGLVVKNWTCKDIPVSASDFVPSRLLIDQLCISIFQIYSTENIMIKYIWFFLLKNP